MDLSEGISDFTVNSIYSAEVITGTFLNPEMSVIM